MKLIIILIEVIRYLEIIISINLSSLILIEAIINTIKKSLPRSA